MPDASAQKAALEFKSASLTVPALLLASNELGEVGERLREKIAQSPDFFRNSPLMLDLHRLNGQELSVDLEALVALLRSLGLLPIGLRGGTEAQNEAALALGISIHALSASTNAPAAAAPAPVPARKEPARAPAEKPAAERSPVNKTISQPIRSGQRVYSRGDLTVTATVSAGAEIMAEGNIHVYGSLRGRALAGVLGDTSSRIFCMDLQAELLSIAGIYQLRDDIPKAVQHKPAHISLDNQMIVIKDI